MIAAIGGLTTAVAAKSSTATIPIVFEIGGDAVGLGLVASLNRPGGNITGVSLLIGTLSAKRFQIMQETVPKAALIGFLMNPANADAQAQTKDVVAAAQSLGQELAVIQARTDRELESAFATLTEKRGDALLVMADPFFVTRRHKLVELSAREKVPTIYPLREFVAAGGLMSYGASIAEAHRTVGMYVGRILGGEKPADLPVQQATKGRADHQSQDRQGARIGNPDCLARSRRRGDRMKAQCPLLAQSGHRLCTANVRFRG